MSQVAVQRMVTVRSLVSQPSAAGVPPSPQGCCMYFILRGREGTVSQVLPRTGLRVRVIGNSVADGLLKERQRYRPGPETGKALLAQGGAEGWTELSLYLGSLFRAMGSREIGRLDGTQVLGAECRD